MVHSLYSLVFYLCMPLVLMRLAYRACRSGAYARRIAERFGIFKPADDILFAKTGGSIWLHCVSVGETIACAPLIKRLQQQYPDTVLIVTTMTPTGSERVKALFGDQVFHVYAPYDLPGSVQRFLSRVQPKLLVIMETELWPNMLRHCHKRGIPVVLANARLSAKSARGYQRLSALTKPMLQHLSLVVAQHQNDGERFIALGLPASRLAVSGSIKFDIQLTESQFSQVAQLKAMWNRHGNRLIVLAASTHEGEDELIISAFGQLLAHYPQSLLVLVPRHPERFDTVAALCARSGLFAVRRSTGQQPSDTTQVVIGDTMGELSMLYGCADIAIVGGSLVERGGHNMLEAAAWAVPIITGMSDFNFTQISQLLEGAGGLIKVDGEAELSKALVKFASDKCLRQSTGKAALSVVKANRGALDRLVTFLSEFC